MIFEKKSDTKTSIADISRPAKLIVQKYGGATLATPEHVKQVAKRINELHKTGTQVVVVVSAMGQTTNQLIELARNVSPNPHLRELDMLLTTGERVSMSLLSMALNDLGAHAISYTGSQAGILTDDAHVNATIIDVKAFRVEEAIKQNKIVILAGFQGVSANTKEITTLGRGGSDTSAVAMAGFLKADRCEILKDVDSIYTADPKVVKNAKAIKNLNYDQLLEMTKWGAKVLHYKSAEMAKNKNVTLFVGSAADDLCEGTLITNSNESKTNKAIAVNVCSIVFKFLIKNRTENLKDEFNNFVNRKQIGSPEILDFSNEVFYISGPQENLLLISKLNFENSNFTLLKSNLCSVSLTCSSKPTKEMIAKAEAKMKANQLKYENLIVSANNINFVLDSDDQDMATQALHGLIEI